MLYELHCLSVVQIVQLVVHFR